MFADGQQSLKEPSGVSDFVFDIVSDVSLAVLIPTLFCMMLEGAIEQHSGSVVPILLYVEVEVVHYVLLELDDTLEVLSMEL